MQDTGLQKLLASRGLVGRNADAALHRLREQGLTRLGKRRIAVAKIEEVDRTLSAAFVRYCGKTACLPPTPGTREAIVVPAKHCEFCCGSDNRRAVEAMLAATERTACKKLLVAGGSPGTRNDLEKLCHGRIKLRFVTEETRPSRKTVRAMLEWSDIAVIWCSTEISHKATTELRGNKVLRVARRGVAALAEAVRDKSLGAAGTAAGSGS